MAQVFGLFHPVKTLKMRNKTVIVFFSILFVLVNNMLNAQSKYRFENEEEFVCISGDTVTFKLSNEDAFGSFYIGKGLFTRNKDNLCIEQILGMSSNIVSVKIKQESDFVLFSIFEYSGDPMEYVSVKIKDTKTENTLLDRTTNKKGELKLSDIEENKLNEHTVKVILESVGFYAEKELLVIPNNHYTFKCQLNFPFTVFNKVSDVRINQLTLLQLKVKYKRKIKVLQLTDSEDPCNFN